MQRFKYVADLVKKKKEKVEVDLEIEDNKPVIPLEISAPTKKASANIPAKGDVSDVKKEVVGRQNSSSSNYSGSDNEWCIVDEQSVT